jgi:hypothetical protein
MKLSIFTRIKNYLTKSTDKKDETKEVNITGSITFDIIDDTDIRIKCSLPEVKDFTNDELMSCAENYAKLLSNIMDGFYSQKIADILLSNSDKEDEKTVLLVNNIISFWSVFHVENYKNLVKYSNQPLVRPSKVFKRL